jgi:DNA-binding transcriptional MerR regulator
MDSPRLRLKMERYGRLRDVGFDDAQARAILDHPFDDRTQCESDQREMVALHEHLEARFERLEALIVGNIALMTLLAGVLLGVLLGKGL